MYIIIGFGVIIALAASLLKVKYEIRKSREMFKEFDEAIEQNARAFDLLNETQLVRTQRGSLSRSEARLIELYLESQPLNYRPLLILERRRAELHHLSYREALEPKYERIPDESLFNNTVEYCESMAS